MDRAELEMLVGAQDDDLFGSAPTETTVVLARRDGSLMTPLGLAAGEVLIEIEWSGAATLRQLIRKLDRPVYLVMMAVGVLIRQGLVRATQRELEVLVEPILEWVRVPRVNAMASQA